VLIKTVSNIFLLKYFFLEFVSFANILNLNFYKYISSERECKMLSDTPPEIEKVQIDLIKKWSVAKRISMMRALTAFAVNLSKRAIARANPGCSNEEINLLFVANHYGEELANRLREYLQKRNSNIKNPE